MSSFSAVARKGLILFVLSGTLALAGCSGLRPVYGDHGIANARMEMNYGKPASRRELRASPSSWVASEASMRRGRSASASLAFSHSMTIETSGSWSSFFGTRHLA